MKKYTTFVIVLCIWFLSVQGSDDKIQDKKNDEIRPDIIRVQTIFQKTIMMSIIFEKIFLFYPRIDIYFTLCRETFEKVFSTIPSICQNELIPFLFTNLLENDLYQFNTYINTKSFITTNSANALFPQLHGFLKDQSDYSSPAICALFDFNAEEYIPDRVKMNITWSTPFIYDVKRFGLKVEFSDDYDYNNAHSRYSPRAYPRIFEFFVPLLTCDNQAQKRTIITNYLNIKFKK